MRSINNKSPVGTVFTLCPRGKLFLFLSQPPVFQWSQAELVGYESQSKFAKAFADQFRLTPLEYRRLAEK